LKRQFKLALPHLAGVVHQERVVELEAAALVLAVVLAQHLHRRRDLIFP
jgi:hypothetical protein